MKSAIRITSCERYAASGEEDAMKSIDWRYDRRT
jgi:hypothetical protein